MKVHPYLSVIQGHKTESSRRAERKEPAMESSALSACSAQAGKPDAASACGFGDMVAIVSLENRRALALAPPRDLGEAELLLQRIKEDLGGLTLNDLRGLHRLEGLVHVFST
ncbi:MAG: hypothetical protein SV487_09050 [Thermodesulfobacteriota bacterium]|nr:hypothetical protein [Thermodesulfobacteriota bacterium]